MNFWLQIEAVQSGLGRTPGSLDKCDMKREPAWPHGSGSMRQQLAGAHRSLLQLGLFVEPQAPHDQRHQGADSKLQAGRHTME